MHNAKITEIVNYFLDVGMIVKVIRAAILQVRAFAGWPGTSHDFILKDPVTGAAETLSMKVVRTRLAEAGPSEALQPQQVCAPSYYAVS